MVTHNLYKEVIDVKLITETMGRGQKETLQKEKINSPISLINKKNPKTQSNFKVSNL